MQEGKTKLKTIEKINENSQDMFEFSEKINHTSNDIYTQSRNMEQGYE
jgi:hypothetical protein